MGNGRLQEHNPFYYLLQLDKENILLHLEYL